MHTCLKLFHCHFLWLGLLGVPSLKARWNDNSEQLVTNEEIDCHVMQVILFNMQMLLKLQFTVEQLYNFILHTNNRLKIVPHRLKKQFRGPAQTCAFIFSLVFICLHQWQLKGLGYCHGDPEVMWWKAGSRRLLDVIKWRMGGRGGLGVVSDAGGIQTVAHKSSHKKLGTT